MYLGYELEGPCIPQALGLQSAFEGGWGVGLGACWVVGLLDCHLLRWMG